VLQLVPAACCAPLAARLTDRRGGAYALRVGYAVQAVALAGAGAAMLAAAPPAAAYAGAVVASTAVSFTRPAQAALLAGLVDRPAFALIFTLAAQFVAIGALDVLAVVLAIGPLGLGQPGAGYLTAVFGAGAIAGSVAAAGLVGARTLVGPVALAGVAWAAANV